MTKPITPGEVKQSGEETIPDEVIEIFNELIIKYYQDEVSTFTVGEVVDAIFDELNLSEREADELNYPDIRKLFEGAGWSVGLSPSYRRDDLKAHFHFIEKII